MEMIMLNKDCQIFDDLMDLTAVLKRNIPFIEPELLTEMKTHAKHVSVPTQTLILDEGAYVGSFPLVLSGNVRVFIRHEDKELLLYYIRPGESCIMSFAACIRSTQSEVAALTETESELLLIPADHLSRWMHKYPSLGNFLLQVYHKRYLDLLQTVEQFVFWKLEDRLAHYLQEKSHITGARELHTTHQQIAMDLGSSREVISRLLRKLETSGKILTGRNRITIQSS
ncbi:MAG: Crp/Fnr family transcriptional regulator [Bacteroidota bacterium]